jgi:uncharacterized protein
MKHRCLVFISVLTLAFSPIVVLAQTQTFPAAKGYVNDFANLLMTGTRTSLENELSQFHQNYGAEVAVVTIETLNGDTIEDYAVRLFEAWGIGQKDKDNGVLFIISKTEKKTRIEVGYGLTPIITAGRAGRILDEQVLPSFRQGDYDTGIKQGAVAIEQYIRQGTPPSPIDENPIHDLAGDYTTQLTVLGIITIYLMGFMARSRSIWLGTIWGVIAGVFMGLMVGGLVALTITPIISGAVGALLDFILSRNYAARSSQGLPTTWWSSGGGFRGGGGGSSFGGFSGGHSGGGGASRGW